MVIKFKKYKGSVVGTSLIGEIDVSYKQLVKVFGKPDKGDGYKTEAEWRLKFEDGTIATIYDYKSGKSYDPEYGLPVEKIRDWHIGGRVQEREKALLNVYMAVFGKQGIIKGIFEGKDEFLKLLRLLIKRS